jgi:hypothetical protein
MTAERLTDGRALRSGKRATDAELEGRRPQRLTRSGLAGGIAFLLTFAALLSQSGYLFSRSIYDDGDFAANSILADVAEHGRLLVGNYSRVGFHHPGPFLLYVAAAGQTIFHQWLHLVPADYNGELLAWMLLNAVMVGLAVRTIHRLTDSLPIVAVTLFVILAWSGEHAVMTSAWFPYLYYPPFLLLGVSAAALLAGDLRSLPVFVFAGGVLVHGHVSFILFVGVTTVVLLVLWCLGHRRTWRDEVAASRGPIVASGVLFLLFLLPIVLDLLLHWPGQWKLYYNYELHSSGSHSLGAAVDYDRQFWAGGFFGWLLVAAALVCAVALVNSDPDRRRARFVRSLLVIAALLAVIFLYYTMHGVDILSFSYIGIFSTAIPCLVVLAGTIAIFGRLQDRANLRGARTIAVLALVAIVPLPAFISGYHNSYRGAAYGPAMVAAVRDAPARGGRTVSIQFPFITGWPFVAGLVEQAHRAGFRVCLENATWSWVFTAKYICAPGEVAHSFRITLVDQAEPTSPSAMPAAGSSPIWSDSTNALYPLG